ncbi:hypothetical protein AN3150.2 [Aspergillus nidulans FGSC A4]|nr:hypothetical protein AN3150.2 [Aspergillus nidulans FGSC A4]|eukprot:XP_660754.1 hypothetical protein AN3150.2 [Aspergillus nidulans FGSC A4]
MGLLALGTALEWPEAKKRADQQLLANWHRAKGKERDALLWGDEVCALFVAVEYLVVALDDAAKKARLSLAQADILKSEGEEPPHFHPEFGRFMLEATPGVPWGIGFKDLLKVESNMRWRREVAKAHMAPNESPITLTTFPRLGTKDDYIQPYYPPSGPALRSQFVPDEIANPHIRFPTLAANIRARRGRKVELNVPVFKDKNTPEPFKDPTVNYDLHNWPEDDDVRNGAAKDGHVYMDAMAFGMGSCCLQITFQAKNVPEGRKLYDQLSPLGPILLALTAATPIYKGFLVDTDVRWNQISKAVDDRTREELGEVDPRLRKEYLDPDLIVDEDIKKRLMDDGMDELLATHFAHLFIRDPIVIFSEDLEELDLNKADHFENLQSTNWQHMRFKPPPPEKDDIGWRVEFRSMEIQMTDFENAAFSIFIVLVTRAILSFDLNFYIPIQRTAENMETAHARNAVLDRKFYFRKDPFSPSVRRHHNSSGDSNTSSANNTPPPSPPLGPVEYEFELMTISDIINGSADGSFPGLIPLVESYLNSVNVDVETRCSLARYLDLIRKRANGTLWTGAKWIREFVAQHPAYKQDSVVSEEICYDLVKAVEEMSVKEGADGSVGWEMLKGRTV